MGWRDLGHREDLSRHDSKRLSTARQINDRTSLILPPKHVGSCASMLRDMTMHMNGQGMDPLLTFALRSGLSHSRWKWSFVNEALHERLITFY